MTEMCRKETPIKSAGNEQKRRKDAFPSRNGEKSRKWRKYMKPAGTGRIFEDKSARK